MHTQISAPRSKRVLARKEIPREPGAQSHGMKECIAHVGTLFVFVFVFCLLLSIHRRRSRTFFSRGLTTSRPRRTTETCSLAASPPRWPWRLRPRTNPWVRFVLIWLLPFFCTLQYAIRQKQKQKNLTGVVGSIRFRFLFD